MLQMISQKTIGSRAGETLWKDSFMGTPESVSEFGEERNSFNHPLMNGRCRGVPGPSE
jgi:hypothetical protein